MVIWYDDNITQKSKIILEKSITRFGVIFNGEAENHNKT